MAQVLPKRFPRGAVVMPRKKNIRIVDDRQRAGRGRDRPVDRETRRLQNDHRYLSFPKVGFARLVREIQGTFTTEPIRWSAEALQLFQTAAEEYLMYLLADAYL